MDQPERPSAAPTPAPPEPSTQPLPSHLLAPEPPAAKSPAAGAPASEPPAAEPLPPLPSVLRLLARSLRQTAWQALATHATTFRGQVAGCVLILLPALAHPLPLYPVVQLAAVLAGSLGVLVVFGGLVIRAVLQPVPLAGLPGTTAAPGTTATPETTAGQGTTEAVPGTATAGPVSPREALLAVPHHRAAWAALLLLFLAMAAGAGWYLVQAFGGHVTDRLASALLLGLPATALGWAVWQARVMRLRTR